LVFLHTTKQARSLPAPCVRRERQGGMVVLRSLSARRDGARCSQSILSPRGPRPCFLVLHITPTTRMRTARVTDWNQRSNAWADAVLDAAPLEDLLHQLGCDLKPNRTGSIYRVPCPVHGGDGHNCQVKTGGEMPIRWACWSHQCQRTFKPSLLGLVRGALS